LKNSTLNHIIMNAIRRRFGLGAPAAPPAAPPLPDAYAVAQNDAIQGAEQAVALAPASPVPIITPTPEEAAIGPARGFQSSKKRKQMFENINNNSIKSKAPRIDCLPASEQRIYRTAGSAGWLDEFVQRDDFDLPAAMETCK
jgi:hypothetical protein